MRIGILTLVFVILLGSFLNAGALVHSAVTGKIIGIGYVHGALTQITVERPSWPKSHRLVIINSRTKVFYEGNEAEAVGHSAIHKGLLVRAEGGLTTLMDRVVADKIVILKKK